MFKKIIAASAIFAFFACSGKDNFYGDLQGEGPSSSSAEEPSSSSATEASSSSEEGAEPSSSSGETPPEAQIIIIASFPGASEILTTYPYVYTMKAGTKEDLAQFWVSGPLLENGEPVLDKDGNPIECSIVFQESRPDARCERDKTNAILQNTLTNQYSDLHYDIGRTRAPDNNLAYTAKLDRYKLTKEGDQAALGLNAGEGADEGKSIGELEAKNQLSGTAAFIYRASGGVHVFRAAASDSDFWYYKVQATNEPTDIEIPVSDFIGMGSYAGVPFNISQVAKFLWVVEYDTEVLGNNEGSLLVYNFRAKIANTEE